MQHLQTYGWSPQFAALLAPDESPAAAARVVQEHKEAYLVQAASGPLWAEISGKIRHTAVVRADFPAVGDWVILRGLAQKRHDGPAQIARILPRKTALVRRLPADEQLLATNIDIAFLGTSLNDNFNLRRLERYLALARDSGAQPVILLTKADLCDDLQPFIDQASSVAAEAPIHAISVKTGHGLDAVRTYLAPGVTAVILGSSGIGKSTLVNTLADADLQDMMEIREFDDKGRHCTTFRNLVRTTTGGLIIDTPGLRGLALGESTDALIGLFTDIDQLAAQCKFTNCRHDTEPGCAIRAALDAGALDPARLESYTKLHQEAAGMAQRENRIAERKQKKLEKRAAAQLQKRRDQR